MNDPGRRRYAPGRMLFVLLVFMGSSGCSDASVVVTTPDSLVEIGFAYDRAAIDSDGIKTVVVPADADIEPSTRPGRIDIFLEKRLSRGGKADRPFGIRSERSKMGCCRKTEADKLFLSSYGWWDSKEGGPVCDW